MDLIEKLLDDAINDGVFPGGCYAIWRSPTSALGSSGNFTYFQGGRSTQGAMGRFTYEPSSQHVSLNAIWDLASLSKVVATTTATMILVQEGLIDLDQPVREIIPEFGVHQKDAITLRNLLVHDSGLVAFRQYHLTCLTKEQVMSAIYNEELTYETGSQTVYSDLSMILVAEAIERITNQSLDDFVKERIFQPLGMVRTGFFRQAESNFVGKALRSECGPTETIEPWRRQLRLERYGPEGSANLFGKNPRYIQGEVHDPTATVLDGVAGHAGLFSTIQDLTRFLTHFMNRESSIVQPEVWDLFTKQQNPKSTRGLGWDTKSPEGSSAGTKFGPNSYGHTGYTGTSIWVDPDARLFAILLTNRVHPTSENAKLLAFRPKFHDQCWELLNHSGKQNELI